MVELIVNEHNNTVIISIAGEITMTTVNEIDNTCKSFLKPGIKTVAFDMKNVLFIDSFGISRIIKQSKAFSGNGTEFVLINLNDNIRQIFKIATFDRLFNIMTKDEFEARYFNN